MNRRTRVVSRAIAVVIVALLSLASASALAQPRGWHDGDPIPAGYRRTQRFDTRLVLTGAATLVGSYALPLGGAAVNADSGDKALFVPIFGPFVEVARLGIPGGGNGGSLDALGTAVYVVFDGILVADAVAQAAGVVMLALGLTVPKTVLVRDDVGVIKSIRPVPMAGNNMGGFGIAAQF